MAKGTSGDSLLKRRRVFYVQGIRAQALPCAAYSNMPGSQPVGLFAVSERSPDGGPLVDVADDEAVNHTVRNVKISLERCRIPDNGTLYVTSRRVIWLSDVNAEKGYAVHFRSLAVHAVSNDTTEFPGPHIYAQIDNGDQDDFHGVNAVEENDGDNEEGEAMEDLPNGAAQNGDSDEHERSRIEGLVAKGDLSCVREMFLVPQDSSNTEELFKALSAGAAMNPDSGDEDEGDMFFNQEEVMANLARDGAAAAMMDHFNRVLHVPDGLVPGGEEGEQFEDAAEAEEDDEGE
eukprot:jgi/Mesvir1/18893/Mv18890-RA.1